MNPLRARRPSILFSPLIWGFFLLLMAIYLLSPNEKVVTNERRMKDQACRNIINERLDAVAGTLRAGRRMDFAAFKSALTNPPLRHPAGSGLRVLVTSDASFVMIDFKIDDSDSFWNPYDRDSKFRGRQRYLLPARESYSKDELSAIRAELFVKETSKPEAPGSATSE